MREVNFEIISEATEDDFILVQAKIRLNNKLVNSIEFYNLAQEHSGAGIWLRESENNSLIVRVPNNFQVQSFITRQVEFLFNGAYYASFN